jgi:methionyl-tRNA formyltransferase
MKLKIALFGQDISTKSTLIPLKDSLLFDIKLFCPRMNKERFNHHQLESDGIDTYFYDTIKESALLDSLTSFKPDYIISSGLCDKIPQSLIQVAKKDAFNIHPSLLPKYKGPAPWFWIIKNGETHSGISIHQLTKKFDSGEIVSQLKFPLTTTDTYGSLQFKSTYYTEKIIKEFIPYLYSQKYEQLKQHTGTYQSLPTKTDKTIDWNSSAQTIENLVKAGNPGFYIYGDILGQPYNIIECKATKKPKTSEKVIIIKKNLYIPARDYLVEIRIINAKTFGIITGTTFLNLAGLI